MSAIAIASVGAAPSRQTPVGSGTLIASPPVVQNPREDSFGVSIAVYGLCTAWVEYGFAKDDLSFTAVASHHGLVAADHRALHVRVRHPGSWPKDTPVYYRVVAQPLTYRSAYTLQRGEPESTPVYALRLPRPDAKRIRIISINDTHENLETIRSLHARIEVLQPDLLIWNGDTCNDFNSGDIPEQVLLNPGLDVNLAWAATRPLLFSNGNHDVRGQRAREVIKSLAGCPESDQLPYNQALRFGPLALVTLDTGEDKPDRHPVFAGTAAYEPYREQQAAWLEDVLQQPKIKNAAFKVAAAHIPLRGLEGQNDGTTLEGYARYSGHAAGLWLPQLKAAGFDAVIAGHTHSARHDTPSADMPVHQFVGGGPNPEQATVTLMDAALDNGHPSMQIRITNLKGQVLFAYDFS